MKLKIALVVSLAAFSQVYAASITFDIATDTGAATPGGLALGTGFTAYVGTFTGTVTPTSTFEQIMPSFQTLYTAPFASGDTAGANGYFSSGNIAFTDAQGFAGDPLFVLFTNGSNLNAIVTGFGAIPADAAIPNSVAFAIDASNAATLTYTLGSYNPVGENLAGTGGNVVLNDAIPEPSAALLGAFGALGLLRRRRN